MDTFQPEAWKGIDPDFVDDRLSAGDFPPINGGLAGHNRKGLYYVKFLLVVVDLYDPLPDNVLTSLLRNLLRCGARSYSSLLRVRCAWRTVREGAGQPPRARGSLYTGLPAHPSVGIQN